MKIYWIAPGLPETTDLEQITLASHRYRVMMPAQALQSLGHEVTFQNLLRATAPETLIQQKPDVLIVGKLLPSAKVSLPVMAERLFSLLEQARNMAIPVIADINDDHFNHPSLGKLWQQLLKACTAVVSGSSAMQAVVQNYCQAGQLLSVVGDPVATLRGTAHCWQAKQDEPGLAGRVLQRILPKTATQRRLHLLWYGNPGNWPAVEKFAQQLASLATTQPFIFEIVSAMEPRIEMFVDTFNARHGAAACMDLFPWSTETLSEAMARADLVVIPADVVVQGKNVKTANRLIDALYAGRFVVAAPVPSYQEFAEFSWQGSDLLEGIQFYLQYPEAVLQKVQAGQAYIAQHYTVEAIAIDWESAFLKSLQGNR